MEAQYLMAWVTLMLQLIGYIFLTALIVALIIVVGIFIQEGIEDYHEGKSNKEDKQ